MGKLIPYARTEEHTVWRDTSTHCGFIEDNVTRERTNWFVCLQGAEQLKKARRMRHSFPILFDQWCRDNIMWDKLK